MSKCCAPHCLNSQRRDSALFSFHSFPEDQNLRAEWISQIGRPNWSPGKRSLLCSAHFEKHSFKKRGLNVTLCKNAIPSIFKSIGQTQSARKSVKGVKDLQKSTSGGSRLQGKPLPKNCNAVLSKKIFLKEKDAKESSSVTVEKENLKTDNGDTSTLGFFKVEEAKDSAIPIRCESLLKKIDPEQCQAQYFRNRDQDAPTVEPHLKQSHGIVPFKTDRTMEENVEISVSQNSDIKLAKQKEPAATSDSASVLQQKNTNHFDNLILMKQPDIQNVHSEDEILLIEERPLESDTANDGNMLVQNCEEHLSVVRPVIIIKESDVVPDYENEVMLIDEVSDMNSDIAEVEMVLVNDADSFVKNNKDSLLGKDLFSPSFLDSNPSISKSSTMGCNVSVKEQSTPPENIILVEDSANDNSAVLIQKNAITEPLRKSIPNIAEIAKPFGTINQSSSAKILASVPTICKDTSFSHSVAATEGVITSDILPDEQLKYEFVNLKSAASQSEGFQKKTSGATSSQFSKWQIGTWMCRLCGIASTNTMNIFGKEGEKMNLSERITSLLPIKISENDGFPHSVCSSCIARLDACSHLIVTCLKTQKHLATMVGKSYDQMFDVSALQGMNTNVETNVKGVKKTILMMEICHDEEKSLEECLSIASEDIKRRLLSKSCAPREPLKKVALISLCHGSRQSYEDQIKNAVETFVMKDKNTSHMKINVKKNESQALSSSHGECVTLENDAKASNSVKMNEQQFVSSFHDNCVASTSKPDEKVLSSLQMDKQQSLLDSLYGGDHVTVENDETASFQSDLTDDLEDERERLCTSPVTIRLCISPITVPKCMKSVDLTERVGIDPSQTFSLPFADGRSSSEFNASDVRIPRLSSAWQSKETAIASLQKIVCWENSLTHGVQLVCRLCQHVVDTNDTLQNHLRNHRNVICHECFRIFTSKEEIRTHVCGPKERVVQPVVSFSRKLWKSSKLKQIHSLYTCSFCFARLESRQNLIEHLQLHYQANSKRKGCKFVAADFNEALNHRLSCSMLKPKEEWECVEVFTSDNDLKEQLQENGDENSTTEWPCDSCGKKLSSLKQLNKHRNIHLPAEFRFIHQCPQCPKRFAYLSKAKEHMHRHEEKSFMCEECGKMFGTKQTLRQHEYTHKEPSFSCSQCSRSFYRKSHLLKHMNVHDHSNPRTGYTKHPINRDGLNRCRECKQVFAVGELLGHYKSVHPSIDLQAYVCNMCNAENTSYGELFQHQRDAHKRIVKDCPFCPKSLGSSTQMKYHLMKHEGMFPYNCPHCNNGYTSNSVLQDHIRRKHTGEKPFTCKYCSKGFPTGGALTQHYTVHKGPNQLIPCPVCSQGFKRKAHLEVHMRKHTGEKPYPCPICERPFRQRPDCFKHIRVIHGEDPAQFKVDFHSSLGVSELVTVTVGGMELVIDGGDLSEDSQSTS